jgi:hypothetical protein
VSAFFVGETEVRPKLVHFGVVRLGERVDRIVQFKWHNSKPLDPSEIEVFSDDEYIMADVVSLGQDEVNAFEIRLSLSFPDTVSGMRRGSLTGRWRGETKFSLPYIAFAAM